jgi:hypothetical protein
MNVVIIALATADNAGIRLLINVPANPSEETPVNAEAQRNACSANETAPMNFADKSAPSNVHHLAVCEADAPRIEITLSPDIRLEAALNSPAR